MFQRSRDCQHDGPGRRLRGLRRQLSRRTIVRARFTGLLMVPTMEAVAHDGNGVTGDGGLGRGLCVGKGPAHGCPSFGGGLETTSQRSGAGTRCATPSGAPRARGSAPRRGPGSGPAHLLRAPLPSTPQARNRAVSGCPPALVCRLQRGREGAGSRPKSRRGPPWFVPVIAILRTGGCQDHIEGAGARSGRMRHPMRMILRQKCRGRGCACPHPRP